MKILIGICGGIAAYKIAELTRLLIKKGAQVQIVMTAAAQQFISPLSLQALSGQPVRTELFDLQAEQAMSHIELARWPDRILIAPASANCIAKLAHGLANDLLSTLCLASQAPIYIAPAMNQAMWQNPATQHNIQICQQRGIQILGPAIGDQACGEQGPGRLLEPDQIVQALYPNHWHKKIMITAGPTREALDPVRFISNHSSGKMGFALAQAAAEMGAQVLLISGPVQLPTPNGVERIDVESALDMHRAVFEHIEEQDIFISCAAVADYRPARIAEQKIKKSAERIQIELIKNPDILAEVAALPRPPFTVGFAAETENILYYGRKKRQNKKIDMIAINPVGKKMGFNQDVNQLTVIHKQGTEILPLQPKLKLARQLLGLIKQYAH